MNIDQYIQTGIIESYALGLASPEEVDQFERLSHAFPELKVALSEFENRLESFSVQHSVPPPADIKEKIEDRLRELPAIRPVSKGTWSAGAQESTEFVAVRASTHIRVHKYWRPAFISIFILAKILLALAIYFFVQYQQAGKEIRQLQQQVKTQKAGSSD